MVSSDAINGIVAGTWISLLALGFTVTFSDGWKSLIPSYDPAVTNQPTIQLNTDLATRVLKKAQGEDQKWTNTEPIEFLEDFLGSGAEKYASMLEDKEIYLKASISGADIYFRSHTHRNMIDFYNEPPTTIDNLTPGLSLTTEEMQQYLVKIKSE